MKKIFGTTGPSVFNKEIQNMVEGYFDASPLYLTMNGEEEIAHWLDQCNLVWLAGGSDVHVSFYGEQLSSNDKFSKFDIKRDARELFIIKYCLANKIPLTGCCKALQIMGVYLGLPLQKDISDSFVSHAPKSSGISLNPEEPAHLVYPVGRNGEALLKGNKYVCSFHHQCLIYDNNVKNATEVLGVADVYKTKQNGVIQCVELMRGEGYLFTQNHPEYDGYCNEYSQIFLKEVKKMIL